MEQTRWPAWRCRRGLGSTGRPAASHSVQRCPERHLHGCRRDNDRCLTGDVTWCGDVGQPSRWSRAGVSEPGTAWNHAARSPAALPPSNQPTPEFPRREFPPRFGHRQSTTRWLCRHAPIALYSRNSHQVLSKQRISSSISVHLPNPKNKASLIPTIGGKSI